MACGVSLNLQKEIKPMKAMLTDVYPYTHEGQDYFLCTFKTRIPKAQYMQILNKIMQMEAEVEFK
jgi:hypothetical protein